MSYVYVPARYIYGRRKATLGLAFHGAEAEAGVVGYLSRSPARGVSANFVCERSGRMVQMVPDAYASGSMNPADRSTNKAFYGRRYLLDVLGDYWTNPNAASISVEGEWYAAKGPNSDQVASLIEWTADMRRQFPTLRGAFGHADQTDTKGCPGVTPLMRELWDRIGHGLFAGDDLIPAPITSETEILVRANAGHTWRDVDGLTVLAKDRPALDWRRSPYGITNKSGVDLRAIYADDPTKPGPDRRVVFIVPSETKPMPTVEPTQPASITYPVTVGGKPAGSVTLP